MTKPTAATVKGAEKLIRDGVKGEYSAGQGLYLNVSGAGTGSWIYRYQLEGKRKRFGLGSFSAVSLADARQLASEQRALVAQGIDPQEARAEQQQAQESKAVSFDEVAADYIASQRSGWKNAKHAQQWVNTLATYASPVIGHLAPADITTEHILKILQPIWNSKKETASRVRNRIELVLNAAKVRKLRKGENVAAWRGHLELLLAKHKKKDRSNHPALPWAQMGEFWQALKSDDSTSASALRLTILTALRTSEVLEAEWSEIDLKAAVWTVPAERMKADKPFRVPLSSEALSILHSLPRHGSGLLFEGRKEGKPISNMAMLMKVRRMDAAKFEQDGKGWRDIDGRVITVHGFRSSFRDWAADATHFQNFVAEQALAHTISSAVEAAYRRGELFEKRRDLMNAWTSYVTQAPNGNVLQMRKEA